MNLYVAGIYTSNFNVSSNAHRRLNEVEQRAVRITPHLLESYHYIKSDHYVNLIREDGKKVFLDSGAFSAFTKGVTIDIRDYCAYIQRNKDIILEEDGILVASVLDSIGDPLKTWQNQDAMERQGVKPLPCYHYHDGDERFLEDYVKRYDYITLGGMVAVQNKPLRLWLDRIWEKYLIDGAGRPKIRVHGFGLMAEEFLRDYPWYSTDSSSWVQAAMNGGLLTIGYSTKIMRISSNSPQAKVEGAHYDNLPPLVKEKIASDIEQRGWDVERLRTFHFSRWAYNVQIMNELNDKYAGYDQTFKITQKGIF